MPRRVEGTQKFVRGTTPHTESRIDPQGCDRSGSFGARLLELGKAPLGPALVEPASGVARGPEAMDRLMRHHAEGATAVGDHLAIAGELIEALLQLGQRNGSGALD